MRILRLVDDAFALELHPYITVVQGLDEARREAVTSAVQEAAMGRTSGLRGLIEVHGVVLDLDDRSLALLELGNDEVETCVWASDLPGSVSGGLGRQVRAAEHRLERLEQPQRDRAAAVAAADERLDQAVSAEQAVRDALAALDTNSGPPAPRSDAAERSALDDQIDADAGRALDDAVEALGAAQQALAQAQAEAAAPVPACDGTPDDDAVAASRPNEPAVEEAMTSEEVADRLGDLRAALALHRLEDPTPIRDALDEVRLGHNTGEMAPSTVALSIADRIEALERDIGAAENGADAPTSADLESVADDADRARTTLAEAERRASESGTAADVEALEVAHAEVEEARAAAGKRLGRARAQRRLGAAVVAEHNLLERLGLSSYTEFLTLGGAASRPDASAQEVERARLSVERAEAAAGDLEGRVDAALATAALVASRAALLDEARAILDDDGLADDEVTPALIAHRVPAAASTHIDVLVDLLDNIGLPVGDLGLADEEIESMAAEWLTDRQHAEARMLRRIDELETRLEEPTARDGGQDQDAQPVDETDRSVDVEGELERAHEEVVAAERAVQAAKGRVMTHERALAQMAALDAEAASDDEELAALGTTRTTALDEATAAVDTARQAAASAQAALDAGQVDYSAAVEELAALRRGLADLDDVAPPVEEVEWFLLARLASQRQQSFVGSLPFVLVETLDAIDDDDLDHLLDRLERMAGAVQIVHLSDDPRVAAWADALPDERGAVVRPLGRVG